MIVIFCENIGSGCFEIHRPYVLIEINLVIKYFISMSCLFVCFASLRPSQ